MMHVIAQYQISVSMPPLVRGRNIKIAKAKLMGNTMTRKQLVCAKFSLRRLEFLSLTFMFTCFSIALTLVTERADCTAYESLKTEKRTLQTLVVLTQLSS